MCSKFFDLIKIQPIEFLPQKQYLLLNALYGEIIIIDADTFQEVAIRTEPNTSISLIAVCRDTFYSINTYNGEIYCTPANHFLTDDIEWSSCGNFMADSSGYYSRGNIIVVGDLIYFLTYSSHFYVFNTIEKSVSKLSDFQNAGDVFHSLVVVHGVIYGYKTNSLKYFDGVKWNPIPSSISGNLCALIEIDGKVCLVGGRDHMGYQYTVSCYNAKLNSWTKINPLNHARNQAAAVATKDDGWLIVGGYNENQWMDSIELFDEISKHWHIIPYKAKLILPQAVTFYA